jgi:hypothetical protein
MDTSDPNITLMSGCDYCRNYYQNIQPSWHPNEVGEKMIALIENITGWKKA